MPRQCESNRSRVSHGYWQTLLPSYAVPNVLQTTCFLDVSNFKPMIEKCMILSGDRYINKRVSQLNMINILKGVEFSLSVSLLICFSQITFYSQPVLKSVWTMLQPDNAKTLSLLWDWFIDLQTLSMTDIHVPNWIIHQVINREIKKNQTEKLLTLSESTNSVIFLNIYNLSNVIL